MYLINKVLNVTRHINHRINQMVSVFSFGKSRSKNVPILLKIVSRMLGVVGRITFGPKILGWVALAGP